MRAFEQYTGERVNNYTVTGLQGCCMHRSDRTGLNGHVLCSVLLNGHVPCSVLLNGHVPCSVLLGMCIYSETSY